jgi:hypothetical protein
LKKLTLVISTIIGISFGAYSQTCDCFVVNADSIFPHVPMTQGTDRGYPPYYHCNNCSSQAIVLPFSFCFYGKNYDTVFVNNKGNLTFSHPDFDFSAKGFPFGNDTLMLAPYYVDVDDSPRIVLQHILADITYTVTATHLIVQWSNLGYNVPDCDFFNSFQITLTNGTDSILPAGNNVSYCYYLMGWASGDSGSIGFNGIPGKIGVNKGDGVHYAQFGAFDFHGYTYYGPYDTTNQLYWLNGKSFIFNTCVTGNNIPPVMVNSDSCSIDTVCAGDTISFGATFLCSEKGQKTVLTVSSPPGLSGLTYDTLSGNSLSHATVQVIAALHDTGSHIITITATDNSFPALSNSKQYTIVIKNCDSLKGAGINKVAKSNSSFSIFPNPNKGKFTIQVTNSELPITNMEVFNLLGEQVYSQFLISHSSFPIDLSSQPKGVYFVKLFSENTMIGVQKVVIQ